MKIYKFIIILTYIFSNFILYSNEIIMNKNDTVKIKFNSYYKEWIEYVNRPEVNLKSETQYYLNSEAYKNIVKLDIYSIPLIFNKIKEEEFLKEKGSKTVGLSFCLIYAFIDMLKIDFPGNEKYELKTWKVWWELNKNIYLKKIFTQHYNDWIEYLNKPEIKINLDIKNKINNTPFYNIVDLDNEIAFYIITKLKTVKPNEEKDNIVNYDLYLIYALEEIFKIKPYKTENISLSEKAKIWFDWWDKNKENYGE